MSPQDPQDGAAQSPVQSPPPTPQGAAPEVEEPRAALNRLAHELAQSRNRRLLVEFLRLRRLLRST